MKNTNTKAIVTVGDLDGVTVIQGVNGKIEAVSALFTFSKLTGLAASEKPDGTVVESWQCRLVTDATNTVVGWAWPAILQADLPAPDVIVTDTDGVQTGKGYSTPIPGFWDVPVEDTNGVITHYGASVKLPDGNYVEVSSLSGVFAYYLLTI